VAEIYRGRGEIALADGRHIFTSEGGYGSITLAVSGAGGLPVVEEIGYRFHYVDGEQPDGLYALPGGAWRTVRLTTLGECLFIDWVDGRTWDQDPFRFRMYVTAVDRAGNESPRSNVVVVASDGHQELVYTKAKLTWERRERNDRALGELDGRWAGSDKAGVVATMVIRDGRFSLAIGGETIMGVLQVVARDGAKKLSLIDLVLRDRAGGEIKHCGVYELREDTLALCLSRAGATRPARLASASDGSATLYTLARSDPGDR
jgi:uncharacterized protein (TIGR03067 family)